MELIEGIIKFASSYTVWARWLMLGNVFCIVALLIFSPRIVSEAKAAKEETKASKEADGYQLKIHSVELFPPSETASVKVMAFVNGTTFTYPSVGGVEWLQVSPSMSGQIFHLPKVEKNEIRFEMLKREPKDRTAQKPAKLLSQETILFREGSVEGRYRLHGFDSDSKTRSGTASAEIIYSIQPAK